MKVKVNGKERELSEGASVKDLLTSMGLGEDGIAIARNNKLVTKGEWETTAVSEGDEYIIINAAYGG